MNEQAIMLYVGAGVTVFIVIIAIFLYRNPRADPMPPRLPNPIPPPPLKRKQNKSTFKTQYTNNTWQ